MMHKLLSRSVKGLQTQLRATRRHVNCYQIGKSYRGLHTEIEEPSSPDEATPITSPKTRMLPRSRGVTLSVVQDSEQVTVQQVVDALLKFQMKPELQKALPKHQALVVLATLNFASWLEASSEFIPKALQRIVGTQNSTELDVVCACIDGLAPTTKRMSFIKNDTGNREGFAIFHFSKQDLPEIWRSNITASSPNMQSTLTFMTDQAEDVAVTLPLANTLFKNGRHSTLLVSRWRSSGDSFVLSSEQVEKYNVNLPVFGWRKGSLPPTHIRTVSLTPIRRIVNGLGNIVRRIEFGEGDVGPASRELESSVMEYLARLGDHRSTIDVWALVIPQEAFPGKENELEKVSAAGMEDVRNKWSFPALDRRYVGNWLEKGAILCRVLSGGGGWGAKQGLLSLDPQTTYSAGNESRFEFSDGSLDEKQLSALGNIAQEGFFIQFLAAAQENRAEEHNPELTYSTRRSIIIGAIPSTIDEMHRRPQEKQLDKEKPRHSIQVYLHHFGCVSESGMFLHRPLGKSKSRQRTMPMIKTKIDIPYSYITDIKENPKREVDSFRVSTKTELPVDKGSSLAGSILV